MFGLFNERDRVHSLGDTIAGFTIVDAVVTGRESISSMPYAHKYEGYVTLSYDNDRSTVVLPEMGCWKINRSSGEIERGWNGKTDTNVLQVEYLAPQVKFWFIVNGKPYGVVGAYNSPIEDILVKEKVSMVLISADKGQAHLTLNDLPIVLTNGVTQVYYRGKWMPRGGKGSVLRR